MHPPGPRSGGEGEQARVKKEEVGGWVGGWGLPPDGSKSKRRERGNEWAVVAPQIERFVAFGGLLLVKQKPHGMAVCGVPRGGCG